MREAPRDAAQLTGWGALKRALEARPKLSFTRRGAVFLLVTFSVGVAAIKSGNNLLYLILGMMLALIVSSGLLSSLNLHKLRVLRATPSVVSAGERFEVKISLKNFKRRWPSLDVNLLEGSWQRVGDDEPVDEAVKLLALYFFSVEGETQERCAYELTLPQRGRYVSRGARVKTSFPFGLFEKSLGLYVESSLIATPRLDRAPSVCYQALGINNHGLSHEVLEGSAAPLFSQRESDELIGLRALRVGEPLKHIHWRASAKRGRLIKREHSGSPPQQHTLWLCPYYHTEAERPSLKEQDDWANMAASVSALLAAQGGAHVMVEGHEAWSVNTERQLEELLLHLTFLELSPRAEALECPAHAWLLIHPSARPLLEGDWAHERLLESAQGGAQEEAHRVPIIGQVT